MEKEYSKQKYKKRLITPNQKWIKFESKNHICFFKREGDILVPKHVGRRSIDLWITSNNGKVEKKDEYSWRGRINLPYLKSKNGLFYYFEMQYINHRPLNHHQYDSLPILDRFNKYEFLKLRGDTFLFDEVLTIIWNSGRDISKDLLYLLTSSIYGKGFGFKEVYRSF
ncbi:MAG: hypothetical protein QXI33_03160 [Candidatus Pacearchaeota archaeon]